VFRRSSSGATQNRTTVAEVHTLIVAPKDSSTLRASFLLFDDGVHTDVAPEHELYLTMHDLSEMAEASSAHHISGINELISSRRVEGGIYEAVHLTTPVTVAETFVGEK